MIELRARAIRLQRLDDEGQPVGEPTIVEGAIDVVATQPEPVPCVVVPYWAVARLRFRIKPWSPLWAFMGIDMTRPIVASQRRRRHR